MHDMWYVIYDIWHMIYDLYTMGTHDSYAIWWYVLALTQHSLIFLPKHGIGSLAHVHNKTTPSSPAPDNYNTCIMYESYWTWKTHLPRLKVFKLQASLHLWQDLLQATAMRLWGFEDKPSIQRLHQVVGTNPLKTLWARQIGSIPDKSGWKYKNIWNHLKRKT